MEGACFISRFDKLLWCLYVHVSTCVYEGKTWWGCTNVWTLVMVWTAESSDFILVVLSIKGLLHICCPVLTTSVVILYFFNACVK